MCPNCDAHSPVNRFEPCNNSTTCAEYSLKGTVATACLALLEGDCLSVLILKTAYFALGSSSDQIECFPIGESVLE